MMAAQREPPNRTALLRVAQLYLNDAANTTCGAHTRYSAAMRALEALCEAGIGDEHDRILLDLWEASRYDIDAWPNAYQVAVVVLHVTKLIRSHANVQMANSSTFGDATKRCAGKN